MADLLSHAADRFGIVTVQDVTLFDISIPASPVPVMELDTLKMSNISSETQEKQIKGGRYADLLVTYNYGRTINLEFQDALLSMKSMQELWGATLTENNIEYNGKVKAVYGTGVQLVDHLGSATNVIKAFNITDGVETGAATVTAGGIATFASPTPGATDEVLVYYDAKAITGDMTPVEALLKSSSFPKTVKFVGKTFFIEQQTGKMVEAEIEIPKLKLNSNFTLTMEAEGDASVFDFSGMALVDNNRELIKFKTIRYITE